ncbi:YcxB family protein [Zooshikella ganghwensis]|uniref:YcxB family protein n=1 Tax=Zooshikella ganghwensis TaxID=202772 RepID=UPI000485ADB2|nr:YcxB family protein [Zooshikella ganghwensis]
MKSQYRISSEEYIKAGLLNGEMSSKSKKVHMVIDVSFVVVGLVFIYLGNNVLAVGFIGAAIGGNLLPFIIRRFYTPWYLKRHFHKYPAIQKPISISVLENGVKFESESGEGTIMWNEIHHWREGKDMVLIYLAPKIYYVVPKRVPEVDSLCVMLCSKVGNAT